MAGTLTPTPYQTVLDGDGVAVSGAKITTTDTGTGVAAATYTSADLSAANTNPIVADSAGRYVAYLPAGANFTFAITTSADVAIETQANIQSVPGSSVNLDIEGTVGEAVTAGQVLYLSSAAEATPLTAGKWYLTDSDAAATSTTPQSLGVAVSAIAINTAGTIRLAGEVNSAGSVLVGTTYYVGPTPGAIVSSAPALARQVGVGLTTSSLLLAATTVVAASIPNPISQDLLFTDATYDIGKSGATRPRDGFFSRNAVVGGTLGVSGISTFTADLVATGASMSFQDAEGITFGTGDDATVKYDGTDLVIAPAAVGSGDIVVTAASIEFADSEGVTLGTGKDATLQYDGTDLVITPAAVGAGDVHVSGGSVEVDDSESFTLGTGKDATIIYDGTDLTISPAAVGSGDLVIAGASAEFADDEGVTLGTGKDATLQYDGTNVEMDTQAVGSGLLVVTGSAAISGVEIDNTATDGDPTLAFTLSGTSLFTMGVDDGDSDKFKIGTTAIGTSTSLTIDGSQNIGIKTDAPDGTLHVHTATAGSVAPDADADDLIVEGSGKTGMSILSPDDKVSNIAWGNPSDNRAANIQWDYANNRMSVGTMRASGELRFMVANDSEAVRIDASGNVFIGDTANTFMTQGLTINQGANDNEILALKSSDCSHGITAQAETDTYGFFEKNSATLCGLKVVGLADGAGDVGMSLSGYVQGVDTTKSTSGVGAVRIDTGVSTGTDVGALGADTNLVVIQNLGTTRFIFDAEGSGHADVEWTTFSDARLKTNIGTIPYGLDTVRDLDAKIFDKHSGYIDDDGEVVLEDGFRRMIGFIAQEVQPLVPELVRDVDDKSFYSLDVGRFTPILWSAVKTLDTTVQDLSARIAALEAAP